jgi:uncharacterized protein YhjY with autotransporter beta-barrel domain
MNAGRRERFVGPALVGAERTAALEQQRDRSEAVLDRRRRLYRALLTVVHEVSPEAMTYGAILTAGWP